MRQASWLLAAFGVATGVLVWSALLGLGMGRGASPLAVAAAATIGAFGPGLLVGSLATDRGLARASGAQILWAVGLYLALPIYFPGERDEALAVGLGLLTGGAPSDTIAAISDALPESSPVSALVVPEAEAIVTAALEPLPGLDEGEIALPYEGEGRRLSVPVVFESGSRVAEVFMMLDTGATYTTLPTRVLRQLGVVVPSDAPVLTLTTANGKRQAQVVLIDRVWLGDLLLEGVAVTTCEDCASEGNVGLLGLNVTGAYNLTIDADHREVVFDRREDFNRRLDVVPFTDLQARFTRFASGRTVVTLDATNLAHRPIVEAAAKVTCGEEAWRIALGAIDVGDRAEIKRRLPAHEPCPSYQLVLDRADW